ncbi:hypothetical protein [Arthrobacter sp. MMS18-M83]|uniref:hypothetical protein n=1 Tax=Arthrobacter sp. MMS18-M83 TaxID=2996261 RepID=UPI00227B2025|nr:hypothetical protein [Arthrobacter sp. MMS18-M83]WAH95629.1 hypothetical protein OW521_14355 [Arthrobacter sp. MMS18-M83]
MADGPVSTAGERAPVRRIVVGSGGVGALAGGPAGTGTVTMVGTLVPEGGTILGTGGAGGNEDGTGSSGSSPIVLSTGGATASMIPTRAGGTASFGN